MKRRVASTWISFMPMWAWKVSTTWVAFVQAQQPGVDEHAGELVADRLVDQGAGHAGVHAAGQAQDDLLVADLLADPGDRLVDVVAHHPVGAAAADVEHEARQQALALHRVGDLGVELDRVEAARLVGHAGHRAGRRGRHQPEARRHLDDLVAVTHPDLEHAVAFRRAEVLDALEQPGVAVRAHLGVAELAVLAALDAPAELLGHGLHAVADAQHRHAELEHRLRRPVGGFLPGRHVAAGQDDALGRELAHEGVGDVAGMDFAVDVRLAHPARDQLGDLRAEVEDQDPVVHERVSRSGNWALPA